MQSIIMITNMERPIDVPENRNSSHKWNLCKMFDTNLISIKNLRIYVIMVAIYQVLVSHVLLFIFALALAHAEEMMGILIVDIADQKEREEYYEMPMNNKGESLNQVRFKTASQLATGTLTILYGCAVLAAVYVIASLSLLVGTLKYRSELMVPWLVFHMFGGLSVLVLTIVYADPFGYALVGECKLFYWVIIIALALFDLSHTVVTYRLYLTLKTLNKLTKSATVAIPCPEPGSAPYHYRKENMYIGDGGHKHLLSEVYTPNCVI